MKYFLHWSIRNALWVDRDSGLEIKSNWVGDGESKCEMKKWKKKNSISSSLMLSKPVKARFSLILD